MISQQPSPEPRERRSESQTELRNNGRVPTPSTSGTSQSRIGPGTSVREILTRYPSAEAIFERHGLLGCGGPNGPREPVAFFARVHQVDPDVLLAELNHHASEHPPAEAQAPLPTPPSVYPLFMITSMTIAILAGFTTGCVAIANASLGWLVLPGVNWVTFIQVHGRIQLYGFAALFVFGVAYHIVPRFVAAPLAAERLARWTFALIVGGLVLGVTEIFTAPSLALHLAFVAGLVLLTLATAAYAIVIFRTVRASGQKPILPIVFVLSGALWLVVGSGLEVVAGILTQPGQSIVPMVEEPALEAVLEGFLVLTAFGVSLRTLPVFAGLSPTHDKVLPTTFVASQLGLVGLVAGAGLAGIFRLPGIGQPLAAGGAVLFFVAGALIVWAMRLFEPATLPVVEMGTGRGWARAVRLAYGWLVVGLGVQAYASIQAAATHALIPWGTLGAARHALALGFVTILIIGMASRVVPVFAGKPLWKPWLVDVAAGCLAGSALLRVPTEIFAPYGTSLLTDALLAMSGPLALTGLIAFALNFAVTMSRRDQSNQVVLPATERPTHALQSDDLLAEALRRPGGLGVLLELGLTFLADPAHRAVAARSLTIAQAARRADRDPDGVLFEFNRRLAAVSGPASPTALSPVAIDPDQTVAEMLAHWPAALDVLVRHGFTPLADPAQRQRLAPTITLRAAVALRGLDLERIVADVRDATNRLGEQP